MCFVPTNINNSIFILVYSLQNRGKQSYASHHTKAAFGRWEDWESFSEENMGTLKPWFTSEVTKVPSVTRQKQAYF